jgi:serine phosphatase RsbU (regulator of sigma subunit)
MPNVDCHLMLRSLEGPEDACGDIGFIHIDDTACFFALVDILGHGPEAYDVAVLARDYLADHHSGSPADIIEGMHEHLQGTRGGVAAIGSLDLETGELTFAGVGNITTRIFGPEHSRLLSKDGIIGYMMKRPPEQVVKLYRRDVVMLYSDGVKEHFELHDCPGLLTGSSEEIARRVMDAFGKGDDDTSCLIVRLV